MKSSDDDTAAATTQLSVSKEERSNRNSRNFPQGVRLLKTSKAGGENGAAAQLCVRQSMMLHGSVVLQAPGKHEKDVLNGGDDHEVVVSQKDGGRERLKRHREEVAGRVLIPDTWGQEELLKDWIDCSAFEALLVPNKIALARKALAADGRRATTTTATSHQQLRIESRC